MTQLARYTSQLYRGLEEETGQATGYRQCGSISIAATAERFEELKRSASMAKVFGLEVNVLLAGEIAEKYPLIRTDDLFGGIHIPSDGYANAVDITQALAKGAKSRGARIFTDTKVEAILRDGDEVTGVRTAEGEISSKYVVICGGMWSRDLAASVGVNLPLHACEHYYVLFEGVEGLNPELPVLRDYDACTYYKYDAGKLLVGAFEPSAKPWGMEGISEDFCFDEIAGDFDHFEPVLHDAMKRLPALEQAGIQKFFCGPESFTLTCVITSVRRRSSKTVSLRRGSTRLVCNRQAVWAKSLPSGFATADHRWTCGKWMSGATCRFRLTGSTCNLA